MEIIKSSGEKEVFERDKLCSSIAAAGAPPELTQKVCELVTAKIKPGDTSSEIYREAFRWLVKEDLNTAVNYSLRKALAELGPAGFIFEQYLEVLLQAYGWETKRNVMMKGECIEHEIDIFAKRDGEHRLIEAKYHHERNLKTPVDVVMYAYARLLDIVPAERRGEPVGIKHKMWLMTNTKFTLKAIEYAKCKGIILTGWNYPQKESLGELIRAKKLYPVTVLPSVSSNSREAFAEKGILLAQDLLPYSEDQLVEELGIDSLEAGKIMGEARAILNGN